MKVQIPSLGRAQSFPSAPRIRFRIIGPPSKASTKRNVLSRCLKERDQQIVRRNLSGTDNSIVQGLQKAEPLLFRKTASDKRKLQPDQIVGVVQSDEGASMPELTRL